MKRFAILRFLLAALATLVVLPYAWSRVYVTPMVLGRVESLWLGILVAGMAGVGALSWRLTPALAGSGLVRWTIAGMGVAWVLLLGTVILVSAVPTVRPMLLFALFVPGTLWVPWLAWIGYGGSPAIWKWGVLGLLAMCTIPFPALVRVAGLTGDAKVMFAWRTDPRPDFAGAMPVKSEPVPSSFGPPGRDDSPQFFGPHRTGVWPNVQLADFETAPPRERWRIAVGPGWSGFAAAGGYCVTQEQRGSEECVTCYRLADGAAVWCHGEMTRFNSTLGGDGPRATPTISGDRVFAIGATGLLVCLEAATGKKVWSVDLVSEFGGPNLTHGVCASPLVDGERVIVCPPAGDGPGAAAFDVASGTKLWQGGQFRSSYASPVAWTVDGQPMILAMNADGLTGHDAADGMPLWHFPWTNGEGINCSQPVLDVAGPGTVLVSTGYGTGSALIRVKRDGPNRWAAEHVWRRSDMKTKFTSAVLHDGHVFGLDDGILECVEAATGKRRWKDGRYGHGQVILAGDRLIVQSEAGELVMVEASATGLKELGRVEALTGKCWTAPVVAGLSLLVRNDREAVCYEIAHR